MVQFMLHGTGNSSAHISILCPCHEWKTNDAANMDLILVLCLKKCLKINTSVIMSVHQRSLSLNIIKSSLLKLWNRPAALSGHNATLTDERV
jgi:hypothetical protein